MTKDIMGKSQETADETKPSIPEPEADSAAPAETVAHPDQDTPVPATETGAADAEPIGQVAAAAPEPEPEDKPEVEAPSFVTAPATDTHGAEVNSDPEDTILPEAGPVAVGEPGIDTQAAPEPAIEEAIPETEAETAAGPEPEIAADAAPETTAEAAEVEAAPSPKGFANVDLTFASAKQSQAMIQRPDRAEVDLVNAQLNLAKQYMKGKYFERALVLLQEAESVGVPHIDIHRLMGEAHFVLENWQESLTSWFKTATLTKRDDPAMLRRIGLKIMRCNAQLSLEALRAGNKSLAAERLAQAIEAIDFSVYVKVRTDMVEAITAYILDDIRTIEPAPRRRGDKPKRIAICLDVIKISPVHTHKHLYLSLAASIASIDPEVTIDIIATFERQITWNAGYEDYYKPQNRALLEAFIAEMVPEGIRERINVHYFESFGLRGVIDTCAKMLESRYDLILYGSGKHGYHGNESLLVRHVLHPFTPTVFFFVQSNNEVDSLNDMIIARGNHPILGEPGEARIEYKSYPPFPGLQAAWVPDGLEDGPSRDLKIVTAWVGVRLDKTLNAYDSADIDQILRLLDEVPNAQWHLIGAEDGANLLKNNKKFVSYRKKKRIFVHPVLEYAEFYRMTSQATLFFQPPGFTGGGGGASIARNNMVPILCFRHSDVAMLQPENFVFEEENLKEGIDAALQLLKSDDARTYLVNLQTQMMESRRSQAPEQFYNCLLEAIQIYNNRIAVASDPQIPKG